jgi:8-oxo-dGTP pyrophosphatase MutT (NUDIX family)
MDLTQNDWKILSVSETYNNPWIKVLHHEVINPSGKNGIYGKVSFKNKAIGIVPIDKDGFTYLVGQFRFTLNEYSWEIPEGGCPIGTEPLDSAKRELKEETGFTANNGTYIGRIHTSNSVTDEEGFMYLAEDLIEGETEFEETENLQIKKIHISEAVKMVMNSEITDTISTTAILKVARMLKI